MHIQYKNHLKLQIMIPIILTAILALLALTYAPFPNEAFLHHLPTLAILCGLAIFYKYQAYSIVSLYCICVFLIFHTLGGFYNYSNVPYSDWIYKVFKINLFETRNHYDRFVHFLFGLCLMIPLKEMFSRLLNKPIVTLLISFMFINGMSALYEIFEWALTLYMADDFALDYNGQQGDVWDAQKDMAFAMCGAILMGIVLFITPIPLADKPTTN